MSELSCKDAAGKELVVGMRVRADVKVFGTQEIGVVHALVREGVIQVKLERNGRVVRGASFLWEHTVLY